MGGSVQIFFIIVSTSYQIQQQNKMKRKMALAADKRKGFEFTTSGEARPLPICYGKNILGGVEVKHVVKPNFVAVSDNSDKTFAERFSISPVNGTKNEFLNVQYALSHGGIEGVQWVKVNGEHYNASISKFNHLIRTHNDGGVADNIASSNGMPTTNIFSGVASASATFRLNRDEAQYNGVPSMEFLIKGQRVHWIEENSGVYSLSTDKVYSNNPALCLLDYLTNEAYGRGLPTSSADLESFYNAAKICDTIVATDRTVAGKVNGQKQVITVADEGSRPTNLEDHTYENTLYYTSNNGKYWYWNRTAWVETTLNSTRPIPLYECNITLSSAEFVRDNIEKIMSTMNLAELTWSSEGKYKLLLEYPSTDAELNALIHPSHYFNDDNLIRNDSFDISYNPATERLNQVTVSFRNEHEDFKDDSVTWPPTNSTAHLAYLAEDNNQPFQSDMEPEGVSDPYHATAMAEQMVRKSRSMFMVEFTVSKEGLSLEPGDFININSETANVIDEVFRVESIKVMSEFTVKISAYKSDHEILAWNVSDDIAYATQPVYDFSLEEVTSLAFSTYNNSEDLSAIAELTWNPPVDGSFKFLVYYTDTNGNNVLIGETVNNRFLISPKDIWSNGQNIQFVVKSQTSLGRVSDGATITGSVVNQPLAPTSFSATESLYQTNKASGVKARVTLNFAEPIGSVGIKQYKIEFYRDEDSSVYEVLDHTVNTSYVFNDIRKGNYHFKITPISYHNHEGAPLISTKEILGLSAVPGDPSNFTGQVTDTGILLTWDLPTDLDVVSGGTTEIRYLRNDSITPKWEIAQIIVNNISGSTTTASLPLAEGYYLIKHIDSSGNASANWAQMLNSFSGPEFNVISNNLESPSFSGTKTNCSVVNSNLELDNAQTTMTYLFNNDIDLGSIENIRLIPKLTASITDGITTVADYDPVSSVTRFEGPSVDAAITFEVRHTNDNPASSPTWSDWETLTAGNFNNRAFQFRLKGLVASSVYTISISELSVLADKIDIIKRGTSNSSTTGDVTVTFATPFYGGINNTDVPYVGINPVGGNSGDTVTIGSITNTGYSYSVYNGGVRVARLINWQAVGQ